MPALDRIAPLPHYCAMEQLRRGAMAQDETKIGASVPTALWMQAKAHCAQHRISMRVLICYALELALGPLEMPVERSKRVSVEAVSALATTDACETDT